MRVSGGCHCGELTYEADIDPEAIGICHCIDCQILSGTAFRTAVRVPIEQFRLLTGTPRTYTKIGGSGNPRVMVFCGSCGTQLYGTGVGAAADRISLRIGTCNERARLKPRREIWRRSAVQWMGDLGVDETHQMG
ncbi:MAG: GFA family protein [Pseudomonadota bacterium]